LFVRKPLRSERCRSRQKVGEFLGAKPRSTRRRAGSLGGSLWGGFKADGGGVGGEKKTPTPQKPPQRDIKGGVLKTLKRTLRPQLACRHKIQGDLGRKGRRGARVEENSRERAKNLEERQGSLPRRKGRGLRNTSKNRYTRKRDEELHGEGKGERRKY